MLSYKMRQWCFKCIDGFFNNKFNLQQVRSASKLSQRATEYLKNYRTRGGYIEQSDQSNIENQSPQWDKQDVQQVANALKGAKTAVEESKKGKFLLGSTEDELKDLVQSLGYQKFYGSHMYRTMLKGANSIDQMSQIPFKLKQSLQKEGYSLGRSKIYDVQVASDAVQKAQLQLSDGRIVETVGIPVDESFKPKLTVNLSSQVGCPMRCTFCASGQGGYGRNLKTHEIIDQILTMQQLYSRPINNIVFMGMGEPLLNIPAIYQAYHYITQHMGIGARNITLSTIGIPNGLSVFSRLDMKCQLSVGLHAPNQKLREVIVPSARSYPLPNLMRDVQEYSKSTSKRLTFEYVLIDGVNDSIAAAQQLVALLTSYGVGTHVNISLYNPINNSKYKRPSLENAQLFASQLTVNEIGCSIRASRGIGANAALGQLSNKFQQTPVQEYDSIMHVTQNINTIGQQ